jgi:hypothetical protein
MGAHDRLRHSLFVDLRSKEDIEIEGAKLKTFVASIANTFGCPQFVS